jgi:hypothetical protein
MDGCMCACTHVRICIGFSCLQVTIACDLYSVPDAPVFLHSFDITNTLERFYLALSLLLVKVVERFFVSTYCSDTSTTGERERWREQFRMVTILEIAHICTWTNTARIRSAPGEDFVPSNEIQPRHELISDRHKNGGYSAPPDEELARQNTRRRRKQIHYLKIMHHLAFPLIISLDPMFTCEFVGFFVF